MSNVKLLTTLAVLLSLGITTACKPPLPPEEQPAAVEARQKAEEDAAKRQAEEDARRRDEEERRRRAEEERREAARRAEEETAMQNAAAIALMDINFDYNRSDIRRTDRDKFQAIAAFMKAYPKALLRIDGHCDERGTSEYNMTLGEKRAVAAKSYLVGLGVNEDRLKPISFGKEIPKFTGHDEKSWLYNRRCEFKLQ
ncbi:MAG: OmpA family protein [Holophagales bacterium]|jgi:peptidoglycan-associated lipoprotein|nr:OmpA family protein [Holophagales bacterium]